VGVNAQLEGESGQIHGSVEDPYGVVSGIVLAGGLHSTVCLRFIDPYGDTVFNRQQAPVLIQELESLLADRSDALERAHLSVVLDLARKVAEDVHLYLKFVGIEPAMVCTQAAPSKQRLERTGAQPASRGRALVGAGRSTVGR
jgi:hypothetical protein